MKRTNIIISDITCMKEKFCIAGWDTDEYRMKRLLINGNYWDETDLPIISDLYPWITVTSYPLDSLRDYPHRTEDVNIDMNSITIKEIFHSGQDVAKNLRDSVSESIMEIFRNNVIENSYVLPHTMCSSLGAIEIPANHITFIMDSGKLRAKFTDNDDRQYCLRVSCKYIRDIFMRNENVDDLNSILTGNWKTHIRIGLARPFFMKENHCYLMLNGLFLC